MTGEEMERAIEFLLQRQASSEARQEKTDEQIAQTNRQLEIYAETQSEFLQTVLRFVESQDVINAKARQRFDGLAEAQQRTEQRFSDLAEAQQHTEQRFSDLAEVQQRTEQRFSDLAEVQQRTEQRFSDLAEVQQRTDQKISDLTEVQQRTQQEISELTRAVNNLLKFSSGNGNSRQE
jgi:chromosome segregation ATPase